MPRAKIVGNMIDMKKKLRNSAASEIQPSLRTISTISAEFTNA